MAKHRRPFDIATTYAGHSGIDYPYASWTPIPATGNGYVSARGSNSGGGYYCWVIYDDGQVEGNFHLPDHSGPGEGSRVSEGTTVGYVGNTGNSTGPHLHHQIENPRGAARPPDAYWDYAERGPGGYVGGGGGAVGNNQRVVGPNGANGRADPSTLNPPTQFLDPGVVATMDGWIYGENVSGNSVWFRGAFSGDWFWSGGFADAGTHDLADLNDTTPPIGPTQRQVGVNPANGRTEPTTSAPVAQTLDGGTIADMKAWTRGETVQGIDVWYQGSYSGNWFWSGGFTDTDPHDLPEVIDPEPAPPAYTFAAFHPVVTDVIPCAPTNYESGANGTRFPADQSDVVLHDFGTDGQDTYAGTISWFQNPAAFTSAHFVVSGPHITQMVSLDDRAFHAGADGNWFVGIEIDPAAGRPAGDPLRDETIRSVNALLDALREHYARTVLEYHRHSEFMTTSCGDDIHFQDYPQDGTPPPDPDSRPVPVSALVRWRDAAPWPIGEEIETVIANEHDEPRR